MNSDSNTKELETNSEHRNWAMACHLSTFAMYLMIPFANMLGPLIIWLIKKDEMPFVNDQGKEVLNFQITMTLAGFICFILSFVVIGFFLFIILGIFVFVITIIAAIKTNNGEYYRYPINLRLIK
ncbi:hypothetical protein MNBD_GAMMA22-1993 [hydrothermal vent metagenome]|uniref:Orotate phosphoribosyltransferase n=1 Tax=hydrothermal vent metagenome TaxID=652676 RepID=A0A3B1AC48_9ZZZZ